MRRLPASRFVAVVVVCCGAAAVGILGGCGSSEQPEAYPGQPNNPPSKQDDLLDMMTGTGTNVATAETPATATAAPTATASVTATAVPTATATAKPKATAKPTATPTAKPTGNEMAPRK